MVRMGSWRAPKVDEWPSRGTRPAAPEETPEATVADEWDDQESDGGPPRRRCIRCSAEVEDEAGPMFCSEWQEKQEDAEAELMRTRPGREQE